MKRHTWEMKNPKNKESKIKSDTCLMGLFAYKLTRARKMKRIRRWRRNTIESVKEIQGYFLFLFFFPIKVNCSTILFVFLGKKNLAIV